MSSIDAGDAKRSAGPTSLKGHAGRAGVGADQDQASEPDEGSGWFDRAVVHAANPKSSARGGVRRFPAGVRSLLGPAVHRDEVMGLAESGTLAALANDAELVTFRSDRVQCTDVKHAPRDGWSDLRPIRRIGSYRDAPNRIGMFAVEQHGCRLLVEVESDLEMCHLRELQFSMGTTWLLTQPFVLRWPVGDRWIWRVPDILAKDADGWFAADVKPDAMRTGFTHAMFDLTERTLDLLGLHYVRLGDLSRQRRRNLRALSAHRWVNESLTPAVVLARRARRSSLGGVIDSVGGGPRGAAVALHLLTRELFADLDRPLTLGTPVTWEDL